MKKIKIFQINFLLNEIKGICSTIVVSEIFTPQRFAKFAFVD